MGRCGNQTVSSRLSDAEYFAALEECAAKGNVTASWVLGAAYIDCGEAPNPPRRGRSIGSLRPKARKESD